MLAELTGRRVIKTSCNASLIRPSAPRSVFSRRSDFLASEGVALTVSSLLPTDKRWLARCSDSLISDVTHGRTRERPLRYFQLKPPPQPPRLISPT